MNKHLLAVSFLLLGGCKFWGDGGDVGRPVPDMPPDPVEGPPISAATDGGDGAHGGILSLTVALPADVEGLVAADGGTPGDAGSAEDGPPADPGDAGDGGVVELREDAGYHFDVASVPAYSLISVGVAGQADILPDGVASAITVDRLELGPGAQLSLSRYPLLTVRALYIGPGATLTLRDAGAVRATRDPIDEPGLAGGSATLVAQTVIVEGTLDASGNDGDPGDPGGFGGHLIVHTESLSLAADGAILAHGGDGGRGLDEQPAP